jgi:hypothetical protein
LNEELENELENYNKYYNSKYEKNRGLNRLTKLIKETNISFDKKRLSWADFGGGYNTIFWSFFIEKSENFDIYNFDNNGSSFIVQEKIKGDICAPKCYSYFLEKYNLDWQKLRKVRINNTILDYFNDEIIQKFDVITQFGLLGLCKNSEEYDKMILKIYNNLADGGTYLGANWIFKKERAEEIGFHNNYLNEEKIMISLSKIPPKIKDIKIFTIKIKDDLYEEIIFLSYKKL